MVAFDCEWTSTSTFGFRAGFRGEYDDSVNKWCPVAYAYEEYWNQTAYEDDLLLIVRQINFSLYFFSDNGNRVIFLNAVFN